MSALGVAIHNGAGEALGAVSVAVPATRFRQVFDNGLPRRCCAGGRNSSWT